jgi:hypothetical protein
MISLPLRQGKSTSLSTFSVPAVAWTPLAIIERLSLPLFDTASARTHAGSPPLFLLHAALLI